MRTLAELPHPAFKISLFGMNQKYIIKFEQGTLEQSYKIAEIDVIGGVDGVFEMLDDDFLKSVENTFQLMRTNFISTYNKYQ